MAANYVSAISGLLPAPLRKLSLAVDQQAGKVGTSDSPEPYRMHLSDPTSTPFGG